MRARQVEPAVLELADGKYTWGAGGDQWRMLKIYKKVLRTG